MTRQSEFDKQATASITICSARGEGIKWLCENLDLSIDIGHQAILKHRKPDPSSWEICSVSHTEYGDVISASALSTHILIYLNTLDLFDEQNIVLCLSHLMGLLNSADIHNGQCTNSFLVKEEVYDLIESGKQDTLTRSFSPYWTARLGDRKPGDILEFRSGPGHLRLYRRLVKIELCHGSESYREAKNLIYEIRFKPLDESPRLDLPTDIP